jgi:hypothetical protein
LGSMVLAFMTISFGASPCRSTSNESAREFISMARIGGPQLRQHKDERHTGCILGYIRRISGETLSCGREKGLR